MLLLVPASPAAFSHFRVALPQVEPPVRCLFELEPQALLQEMSEGV